MNTTMLRYGPWVPSKPIALRLGCKSYFTGRPCMHGHLAPRKTTGAICLDCKKEACLTPAERARTADRAARWQDDPAKAAAVKAKQARYNERHREQRNAKKRDAREFDRFIARITEVQDDQSPLL